MRGLQAASKLARTSLRSIGFMPTILGLAPAAGEC
jgi:hypothetical protein